MNEERTLEVEIEPGVRDGMEYPFIGEGTYVGTALLLSSDLHLFRGVRLVFMAAQAAKPCVGSLSSTCELKCCVLSVLLESRSVLFAKSE